MASNDSQIDKPQHGHPKRAELQDVSINTGAQSPTELQFLHIFTLLPCNYKWSNKVYVSN